VDPSVTAEHSPGGAQRVPREPSAAGGAPDLRPGEPPVPGDIPWGYGHDRVTAVPVDPVWLFVYWELTDEAIENARRALDAPRADCTLRVYDTTYRLFDGLNANWHVDVGIDRPANNHYVRVDRPGSTLHVDIGLAPGDGRFHPIVRSAAIEMPRSSMAGDSFPEWMTVTCADPAPTPYAHRFAPRAGSSGEARAEAGVDVDGITRALAGEGWARAEWSDDGRGGWTVRWVGPFPAGWWRVIEPGALTRVEIVLEGARRVIRLEHAQRMVFGPWKVTIRGLDAHGGLRVLDRWEVHYSWQSEAGTMRVETGPIVRRILEGYRTHSMRSGSEARLLGESGASEALHLGASEGHWLGASEARLAGASESLYLGASEVFAFGASEVSALGASETLWIGASEFMGGSEREHGGASELGGASAWPLGGPGSVPGEGRR
jgi:hypothetical protein